MWVVRCGLHLVRVEVMGSLGSCRASFGACRFYGLMGLMLGSCRGSLVACRCLWIYRVDGIDAFIQTK